MAEHGGEALPFAGEGVAVEPEDVVRVDGADGALDARVECGQADVLRVAGLVDRVVAGDPGIVLVAVGELLPEPDRAVLMVLVVPECCVAGRAVGVPARTLAAGDGVHVEDGVDALVGANVDHAVQVLEATFFENTGVHVVFEVAVIEW